MTTTTTWDNLIEEANALDNNTLTYEELLHQLNTKQREALLLANLNYQIQNGGIQQWVENGYATAFPTLQITLNNIGTPLAQEVTTRLETFVEAHVDQGQRKKRGFLHNYWLNEHEEDETRNTDQEAFDDWYYKIDDAFMAEIEEYLAR